MRPSLQCPEQDARWAFQVVQAGKDGLAQAEFSVSLAGGSAQADVSANVPSQFLPPTATPGVAFSQSSSGYVDPTVQLDINLIGTSKLKSNVDLFNYEPTWTVDAAVMLGVPVGEYDDDKVVNMGLNSWFTRLALPVKIGNFGFTLNYTTTDNLMIRTSFSSNVFGDNDVDNSILRFQLVYVWHTASENFKKLRHGH